MNDRGTSPWVYIGVGCLLVVVLGVGAVVGLGWLGVRQAKRFSEEMQDPETRGAKVQDILGYEELPPGYHPVVSVSIPMLMRMAILSDEPPGPDGEPEIGSSTFVFIDMREFGDDQEEVRAYLEGHGERPRMFDRTNVSTGTHRDLGAARGEAVARGSFETRDVTYVWSAHHAEIRHRDRQRAPGVETLVLAECPRPDRRVRLGVWSVPLPELEGPVDDLEPTPEATTAALAGTPADETALRAFLSHLRPCP